MGYIGTLGMAAGLAVRSSMIKQLGGFDEYLGPGSLFKSGEDYDLAMRALTRRLVIFETADFGVIHYGYRTKDEFRELTKRDWIGIGAAQAKILKCYHLGIIPLIFYNIFFIGFIKPLTNIFRGKKPQGFKRIILFSQGFLQGMRTPVDSKLILYRLA